MFDEEPEPDPHQECAQEIHKLQAESGEWEGKFNHVMSLVRNIRKEHGLCSPRERKACTNCNSREELNRLAQEWKGPRIVAMGG